MALQGFDFLPPWSDLSDQLLRTAEGLSWDYVYLDLLGPRNNSSATSSGCLEGLFWGVVSGSAEIIAGGSTFFFALCMSLMRCLIILRYSWLGPDVLYLPPAFLGKSLPLSLSYPDKCWQGGYCDCLTHGYLSWNSYQCFPRSLEVKNSQLIISNIVNGPLRPYH